MDGKKVLAQFAEFPIPTYDEWREITEKSLKGASFEKKLLTRTYEGITLQPMYQQKDVKELPLVNNTPGKAPFTRGTMGTNTHSKPWEISQELDVATPKKCNEVALHDLARGQTVLNIVLNNNTKNGKGQTAGGELGKKGLMLHSTKDLEVVFQHIDITNIPLHLYAGANSLPVFALLLAYMKRQGYETNNMRGLIAMDPVGELVEQGSLPFSLDTCYRSLVDVTLWVHENAPQLHTILVRGSVYHNGGSSAVEELAFALATGVEYIKVLLEEGLDIDTAAPKITFEFSIGSDFFMEIAKLRAARTLWAMIIEAFGGSEEAQKMTIHARTSAWTKTKYDPYVNMLRATSEAFAAAVGGANSIHVSPFDEPIQKSTNFSRRIARNTSIILQEEAHIGKTIDPAGGSWYVEVLTNEIAENSWKLFQQVEEKGGIIEALKQGFPQQLVEATLSKRLKDIEHRKVIFVGTNMYANTMEKPMEGKPEEDNAFISEYVKSVQGISSYQVEGKLNLEKAVAAASNGALLTDLAEALKGEEGTLSITAIRPTRGAEKMEELRETTEAFVKKHGRAMEVFLANLGPIPSHKARADFAAGFFEVGGFTVIRNNGFASEEEAVRAALDSKADIVVICGKDESYQQNARTIAKHLKAQNKELSILLAGKPSEQEEKDYRSAGIDDFLYLGANVYETLRKLQIEKGVVQA